MTKRKLTWTIRARAIAWWFAGRLVLVELAWFAGSVLIGALVLVWSIGISIKVGCLVGLMPALVCL